jgi:phosphopantetheinyl transferase
MPIVEDLNLLIKTRVIIWEINESISELSSSIVLSKASLKILEQKKSDIHKKQFLAVRNILKYISIDQKKLNYDDFGNPSIGESKISITHSGFYVAIILSASDVGIDIEKINDKVLKIKSKFLETELNYPKKLTTVSALVYWNIKESIYKAIGKKGIDFKKNILVLPLDMKKNKVKSWYIDDDKIYSFDTRFKISKKYTLAFVIKN